MIPPASVTVVPTSNKRRLPWQQPAYLYSNMKKTRFIPNKKQYPTIDEYDTYVLPIACVKESKSTTPDVTKKNICTTSKCIYFTEKLPKAGHISESFLQKI